MSNKSVWKIILVYIIGLLLSWMLIEITWGFTVVSLTSLRATYDKAFQEEVSKILKDKGITESEIEPSKSIFGGQDWYENLPPEVKNDLEKAGKRILQERIFPSTNWFGVTLFVSAFVFAIVSFLCSFITRSFLFIGLIPALSFFVNNPLVRFAQACELNLLQKAIIVLFAQFGICYLFGYMGALFGKKRDKKRFTENTQETDSVSE